MLTQKQITVAAKMRPVRGSQIVLDVRARRSNVVAYETNHRQCKTQRWQAAVCQERNQHHSPRSDRDGQMGKPARQGWQESNLRTAQRSAILPTLDNPQGSQRLLLEGSDKRLWNLRPRSHRARTGNQDALLRTVRAARKHRGGGAAVKCPKCGYEIEAQQNRAAKSRWANMTKAARAAEMSRIRRKGIKKQKAK